MRKVLLIATEPEKGESWSPAREILRSLTDSPNKTMHFSSIQPPRTLNAVDAIVDAVAATDAECIIVLRNARHHSELVLYRDLHNTWPGEADNLGAQRDGEIIADGARVVVLPVPVSETWKAWQERAGDLTHLTLADGGEPDLENALAYRLLDGVEGRRVGVIGVPVIDDAVEHLHPDAVAHTALFLVDRLTAEPVTA